MCPEKFFATVRFRLGHHFPAHEVVSASIRHFAGFISRNDGFDIRMHAFDDVVVRGFRIKTLFETLQTFRRIPDEGQRHYGAELFQSLIIIHFWTGNKLETPIIIVPEDGNEH